MEVFAIITITTTAQMNYDFCFLSIQLHFTTSLCGVPFHYLPLGDITRRKTDLCYSPNRLSIQFHANHWFCSLLYDCCGTLWINSSIIIYPFNIVKLRYVKKRICNRQFCSIRHKLCCGLRLTLFEVLSFSGSV